MSRMRRYAFVYARVALATAFLSAVGARFGLWRNRGPHPFQEFIQYTAEVNSFLPHSLAPVLAAGATVLETTLAIALLLGARLRWTGLAAAILLAVFGTAMAISFGPKSPLDYSVYSASAAALLIAANSWPGGGGEGGASE